MIAVLTGDIINSRKVNSEEWLPKLKDYFIKVTNNVEKWEIYRGDSFQLQVNVEEALITAICIKALIKTNPKIDVRISIGIGDVSFKGKKVIESYGTAFINSGEAFEKLKNNTLIIKTPFKEIDIYFNPIFKLLSFIIDNWKPVTSETIFYALMNRDLLQKEIAERLEKDKTTVNRALKRGAYEEITEIINLFNQKISECIH
ncbi:SatD family protein [Myroides marinus]|uniref:SatD family protein n=1 Tax=Myroides marinus TaxID=703342 RepID=UPI002577EE35|nr:SatD family protein [Myroides marinus]MDM1534504.1 transcriptional regulator [Myroides marinus]MDM1541468.1 transcriptional regulator [Myroides marinus]